MPISLAAVPTKIKAQGAATSSGANQKGAQSVTASRRDKKGKGAPKALAKEVVLRDGFLLEEAGLQCLKSSGSLHGSTKSLTLSAKAFSMPLASVLTANPLAVEGLFSHLLNLLKSEQGLVC